MTLAAVPVLHGATEEHVRELIEHAFDLGIKLKLILHDAAYNSAEVIGYMNSIGVNYIIQIASPIEAS